MATEDPESYLRRFAETQLRRLAAGEATAADCASRVDAVAAAFESTGVLDRERGEDIAADFQIAIAVRSPERDTPLHAGRRAPMSALRGQTGLVRCHGYRGQEDPPGDITVVPAGAVLRTRDEDIYLLSYVTSPGRALLNVAARTTGPRMPRRHASPPSARNPRIGSASPRPSTFAGGGMTAVDDAGRTYDLAYSGGGGRWYLGRLSVSPAPPPDIAWLEVHCGGESARLDLRAAPPAAEVSTRTRPGSPGEAYLLRRAEALLARASAPGLADLGSVVPALRAVGLIPDGSPVPGQVAALIERTGGPGRLIAEPGELPERWTAALKPRVPVGGDEPVAAAHLAAVLPEADGMTLHLAGLVGLPGEGTLIVGMVRAMAGDGGRSPSPDQMLWLRDDAGGWHAVSVKGWSANGNGYAFQATVEPPVGPETKRVEFYVTGATTEVRADLPLTWWAS